MANVTAAAREGDFNSVAQQLLSGADPNERDSNGWSALHFACCHANQDAVQLLIKSMADVDLMARDGLTPLHRVAERLDDDIGLPIVTLLINAGASVNFSLLYFALGKRRMQMAIALVRAGANLDCLQERATFSPFTYERITDVAAAMIAAGGDINLLIHNDFSMLHDAIEHGLNDSVRMLIAAGAEVDVHGDNGLRPLHLAVFFGREAILDMLIEAQADVNCKLTYGQLEVTPLSLCAAIKRPKLIRKLIDAGADFKLADRFSALHFGVLAGDEESCEILLKAGVTADQNDPILLFLLTWAKNRGFTGVVNMFNRMGISAPSSQPLPTASHTSTSDQQQIKRCDFSESLSDSMRKAGFNSVNAIVQSGAAALLQEFSNFISFNEKHLFGSFSDGWGSCLTAINGRVDADSDIDVTHTIFSELVFCIQEFCERQDCKGWKVEYSDGHIHAGSKSDDISPNVAIPSITTIDYIRAHLCCCYPPIELLKSGYQTNISPDILRALKLEVDPAKSWCHVVSAKPPPLKGLPTAHTKSEDLAKPPGHEGGPRMRVSTTMLERILMQNLTTIQGQLFILLKYLIKKVMSNRVQGLKTYIAKNLLFHMLDRTPAADWQPKNLIALVRRTLRMLVEMMSESEREDACMVHFFLRDAAVYLKRDQSPKMEIRHCIENVIDELPELLTKFEQGLETNDTGIIYFQPFVHFFLWMSFPIARRVDKLPDGTISYHHTYDLVKVIVEQLSDEFSPDDKSEHLSDLLWYIWKIPDHARTARECLEAMARIKTGEKLEEAVSCISDSSSHTVSRGIPCPSGDEIPSSVSAAKEFVRKHLEAEDSAWKFTFIMGFDRKPDFRFLPDSIRPVLSTIFQFGFWHMNFDALAKALRQNNPLPVIEDLRNEFGDDVFKAFIRIFLARSDELAEEDLD